MNVYEIKLDKEKHVSLGSSKMNAVINLLQTLKIKKVNKIQVNQASANSVTEYYNCTYANDRFVYDKKN